jgi:hypothetical protein
MDTELKAGAVVCVKYTAVVPTGYTESEWNKCAGHCGVILNWYAADSKVMVWFSPSSQAYLDTSLLVFMGSH